MKKRLSNGASCKTIFESFPRFHLGLFTFNPYGVDIVKRITPAASCFHPGETWDNPDRG